MRTWTKSTGKFCLTKICSFCTPTSNGEDGDDDGFTERVCVVEEDSRFFVCTFLRFDEKFLHVTMSSM